MFAGVNSSPEDVEKGRNRHFRVFKTGTSSAEKGVQDRITEISKSGLFEGQEKEIYQRITRLSKYYPGHSQLGAVATGLSKQSEIVLFDTASTSPPKSRGAVQSNKEAVDVDLFQTGEKEFLFAYCDEHDIYLKKMGEKADNEEPECIYVTPATRGEERPTTPKFRAMRFLTKDSLVMLTNIHGNSGVVLQIFRIPPSGKGECRLAQSIRLPFRVTKATGMAVCNLTPPTSPIASQDYTQFVIAVVGHDISISLYKVDLQVHGVASLFSKIKSFRTLKNVHPLQITGIAFSTFTPPSHPVTAQTPPQHLKLASVGVSNTVVVHTLPLFPVPLSVKRGQSKTPRYVVALPSSAAVFGFGILVSIIAAALTAVLIQGILEIRGGVPVYLNARDRVPTMLQERLGRPYEFPSGYSSIPSSARKMSEGHNHHIGVPLNPAVDVDALGIPTFFSDLRPASSDGKGVTILREHEGEEGVKAHVHDEESGPHGAKTWEDLPHEQRQGWKKKLSEAGHWAEEYGEGLFKGVLFSELGGLVAEAVRG